MVAGATMIGDLERGRARGNLQTFGGGRIPHAHFQTQRERGPSRLEAGTLTVEAGGLGTGEKGRVLITWLRARALSLKRA